jgi:hypothetical protein
MHAMSDEEEGQSPAEAKISGENYMNSELQAAVQAQMSYENSNGGAVIDEKFSDDALTHFGHALHTVQDSTSPEHRGFQPWGCIACPSGISHVLKERRSALSSNTADALARHNAYVASYRLWEAYMKMLEDARKLEEEKKKIAHTQ